MQLPWHHGRSQGHWVVMGLGSWSRTVARKSSIAGLDVLKFDKNPTDLLLIFQLGGLSTPKPPKYIICSKVVLQSSAHGYVIETQTIILHLRDMQARNQLGTPGGAKSFLRGAQVFKRCPTHFSRGTSTPVTDLMICIMSCTSHKVCPTKVFQQTRSLLVTEEAFFIF